MKFEKMISSDSHMLEPAKLWTERLDKKFRDVAPHVYQDKERGDYFFTAPDIMPFPVGAAAAATADEQGDNFEAQFSENYETTRPGGWDPAARLKDQDKDGVLAEVLYTTLGMPLFQLQDHELQRACFGVFNTWLSEFCSYSPKRLIGVGLISMHDIDLAINEMVRCKELGLPSVQIWAGPPEDKPFDSDYYDPFWQAASDMGMAVALHQNTGSASTFDFTRQVDMALALKHEIEMSIGTLAMHGVLEKFPKLIIVSVENDIGYVPHMLNRMDHLYSRVGSVSGIELSMLPSEYVKRQVYFTFEEDPVGTSLLNHFGEDNFMWASDFPHPNGTWPNSRTVVAEQLSHVTPEVAHKIIFENCNKLYNLGLE